MITDVGRQCEPEYEGFGLKTRALDAHLGFLEVRLGLLHQQHRLRLRGIRRQRL